MALKRKSTEARVAPAGPELCLVRWIIDDRVGVMPVSSVDKNCKPRVGVTVDVKWKGKEKFQAEILKISREYNYI